MTRKARQTTETRSTFHSMLGAMVLGNFDAPETDDSDLRAAEARVTRADGISLEHALDSAPIMATAHRIG